MSFEDFLDLMSIFSEQAPRDLKVFYAFKIYDFDGDKYIGSDDLGQALRLLTQGELTTDELQQIAEKVWIFRSLHNIWIQQVMELKYPVTVMDYILIRFVGFWGSWYGRRWKVVIYGIRTRYNKGTRFPFNIPHKNIIFSHSMK